MAGQPVLFDSNAVIALMKDPALLAGVLPSGVVPAVSLISWGELRLGMLHSTRVAENLARLDLALREFLLLIPDVETANFYADIGCSLRRKGRPIPTNDIWIAATALRHGFAILTRDSHFQEVEGLTLLTW